MPPDRLVTQVRSDTLKRMYVTRGLGKKYGPTPGCPGCATIGSHHQASHSDTCRDRMRAELEKSEEGREYLAREQARVDARKQEQSSSSSHKRAVSEEWDRPPEKFWRMGEEDVTMKQDITATSGASSSSASRGPGHKVDRPGNEPQMSKQKIWRITSNWIANESAASLPQAEGESSDGRMFIGNWEHVESETHNKRLEDRVAGDGYLGLDERMDITTVNEQGVQWCVTNVETRNQAFRKIVAEKSFLLMGAHPYANWRSKSNASWSRMTQREKDDELHRARVHMQFVCRMYKLQHDEGRYFLHEHCQSELPWRKDFVEEIQEMTGAKLMSVSQGNCNLSSSEKSTVMVTNCPAIAFTLRVSAKARLPHKRYSEHLEGSVHRSVEDLHEDISCGIQLQHKWNGQHKYLLARVDVKNPQANCDDLENSVPP